MNINELKTWVEQYVAETGSSLKNELNSFADWINGKQAEIQKESDAVAFLEAHGYAVTKSA